MEHVSPLTVLRRNTNYRRLFSARLISLFGDWFNTLAVLALLREMGGLSASAFGWILILKTLPAIVTAPAAGVLADRVSRRAILIGADALRSLVVIAMLGLTLYPSVGLLYLLVVIQSAIGVFFEPARSAMMPDILRPEELTAANALSAAAWSTMLALGSAAGGLLTATAGWEAALVVDAGTYIVSMFFVFGIREPEWERAAGGGVGLRKWLGLTDIAEGLRYLMARPRVLSLTLVKSGWTLAGGITLMLTTLGERVYPIAGDAILGVTVLYVARGIGTGTGPFLARWISRSEPAAMERFIGGAYLCGAVFYVGAAGSHSLWLVAVMVALAHLGGATAWVFSSIRLQQLVPTTVRGRVFAAENAAFTSMMALSTWMYGQLIDHEVASLSTLTGMLGISLLLPAAVWWLRGKRLGWAGEAASEEARL